MMLLRSCDDQSDDSVRGPHSFNRHPKSMALWPYVT